MLAGFFKHIILWINLLLAVALLLADISVYLSPEKSIIPAFFGLGFPYLFLANLGFVLLWIFKVKWYFLFSLVILLFSWTNISNTLVFPSSEEKEHDSNFKKVLTYNIRYFDRYNWSNDHNTSARIINYLYQSKADVICLQEFLIDSGNKRIQLFKEEMQKLGYDYYFERVKEKSKTGLAIFSRMNIVHQDAIHFENSTNLAVFVDVVDKMDTFRIYNLHLQSVHFDYSDYELIDSIQFEDNEKNWRNILHLGNLLKKAYIHRGNQADIVAEHVRHSPYPVLLTGDFNDTPVSYTYRTIRKGLDDAFEFGGFGFSTTYIGKTLPAFRIDYILHSPSVVTRAYEVDKVKYSDHYPVFTYFRRGED